MGIVLLFAALAASALAGPTGQRQTCALHCTETDFFSYRTGKSYVYEYSVTTSTALLGTFEDDARMHITANAHIDVTAPCEYTLRLTEVTLDGSSHAEEFAAALTKSPLRFSFQDGRVESVCSEVSEPAWVLNIKRGVLSTFQNSMTQQVKEDVQETDISGVCVTHYKRLMEGNVMTVEKVKDLSSCAERPELAAYIAATPYDTSSPVKSLPIFKSTNKCSQRIEEGVLKTAECEETHKYRPFSSEEGGAVTTAKTTLSLVSLDGPAVPISEYKFVSKSLVFEQTSASKSEVQFEAVEKMLNDLAVAAHDNIRPEVPALFSTLVASLKSLDYPTLSTVYTNTHDMHSQKFLLDAMPLVGTAASVGVIKDMLLNGDMTDADVDVWFTSLAFFKNPTSDMFTAIAPLLENNPSQKAMLGTSAMVNTFCKINPDCTADQGVRHVLRRIESHLGFGCRFANEEEKMKTLVALKALGNAGHWVNANSILRKCYTDDNDMEVRVAAIEAWRHTPCEYDRSNLLAAFQDETQDPEVRIAAYLAVMTCPTPTVIDTIKDRLTSEGVNQVGSFIWTHMTNMQESAAPGKQWAREMIGEELLQKKFSTDALKFSRNYESSFFMNELNAGAAVESNVIFSSKSYLPKSAMLNLTLDLFGESINLFEVGGRIEGFEAYVERFFGPNGYFPEETIEALLRNMRRDKRDAEATTLEGILDNISDEPEGSYYLRVFGNELYYNHFHGLEELMKTSGNSNPLEVLMDLARRGDVDYTKSYQLIDTEYSIPTVSGLPVTLTAQGTATVALKMNGNFVAENLRNINIEGHFQPSAAVQMDGLMVVDAHVTRTGLKISSTLHTSTFLDGKVKIEGGKLVDIAFNTPRDKIEVIDVNTEFLYLEDDQEIKQEVETIVKHEGCTSGTSGIALCGELSYTPSSSSSPIFPFSGPSAAHFYFKKTDTQSAYILRFSREENEISFLFDTPQSQADHKVSFAINKAEQEIHIDLHTPFKSLQGNGEYTWQKNDKHIILDLTMDGSDKYKLEAGTKTSGNDLIKTESFLIITSPAGDILNVKGTLQANALDAKYVADIVVSNYPIAVHASYDGEENSANVNVLMNLLTFKINANGQLGCEENSVTSKAEMEFSTMGGNTHMIQHSALIRKYKSEDFNTYLVTFELNPTPFADRALTINFRSKVSAGRVESKCMITNGPVIWNLEQLWSYNNDNNHRDFNASLAIDCPHHGIDFLTSHDFKIGHNYLTGGTQVRLTPGKDYLFRIELTEQDENEAIGRIDTKIEDIKATVEVILNKIASGHYTAKVIGNMVNSEEKKTWVLEGALKNNSGKFTVVAEGSFKSQTNEITFSSGIYADGERANVAFRSNINSQKFFIVMEGTRNSILVDANVYRHITINSYIGKAGETHNLVASAEWDKDVDPTKSFAVNGQLSPTGVQASFKYGEKEMSASAKIVDNGVEMEAMWAPERRVIASVHYSLGDTKSLAATVETPFPGWEKQDATFTVSVKDYEISSSAAVTWKNTEQMSLTINGKLQPGLLNNALNTKILFNSNFESFERLSFTLDHNMAETTINTNVDGLWNDSEMKGTFHITPNENGVDASATFTSPFTEEILVSLHHEFVDTALSTSLEAKYGAEISTITLTGQVETGEVHTSTLELKVRTPTTTVPEIDGNIKYTYDGIHLVLVAEGKAGEKKMMLNMTGEKTITESSTAITGDLRFITPFTSPVTVTLAHRHDGQQFTTQFEVSGVWFISGTVKMHAEGHMVSMNDIAFSAIMSSPAIKALFSFSHKIESNAMFSTVDATAYDERISAYVKGNLDVSNILANLKGEVTSTYSGMDDIKVKIESAKDGNTRTSRVILVKGTNSVNMQHIISYDDMLNWENSFEVNGKYKLWNKQTHIGTPYVHELEYMWGSECVCVKGTFDPKLSEESRKIDAQVIVTTPWENYENIKIDFHHQDDGVEYKPTLKIEYQLGSVIEIATLIRSLASSFYIESNLTTPFWQPIEYKLNIGFRTRKAVALTFIHGANETAINVNGNLDEGKMDGYLEIHSTYLTIPILVEASYDIISPEKKVHLSVSLDKQYEFTGSFSGHMKNAKWFLTTELPIESANHIEFSGEYDVTTMPCIISTVLKLNSQIFEVTGKIDTNEFLINMDINGKKGSLSGNWFFQYTQANITANFQSPLNESDKLTAKVMYDFENDKKANVKLIHGTQEFNLIGKLESEIFLFEGTTPFSDWENLSASFFTSKSAIKAVLSRNEQKIQINGAINIKRDEGMIGLIITTPYINFEKFSLEAVHSFQDDIRMIDFKSTFGREVLSLNGVISLTDPDAPEIFLDIITPFEVMKTVGGSAKWNLRDAVKTAEIEAYQNDLRYNWKLEAAAENSLKGYASCKITTTLSGWTAVSVKGNFDFSAVPYSAVFLYDKEGVTEKFEGHLSISENAITGEIVTPITGWEKIYLNGKYSLENNHLVGYTEFNKGSEKYQAGGEILFNNHTPKFHIKIKTPITFINNIELGLEANIANTNKSFSITFNQNDIIYSAEFIGQFYNSGFLEVITRSPLPGYTSLEISAEYDFTSDVKRVDMNVKKEGEDQKFAMAAKIDVNNILINVTTPFEGYESLRMNVDYRANGHQHDVTASFLQNGHTYGYNFHAKVILVPNSISFVLSTPIVPIRSVVLMSTYKVSSQGIEGSIHFERNGEVFKFSTRANFTPMESGLYVAIDTPIDGFNKLILNIMYNFISEKKVAHISVQKDAFFKIIGIKASYSLENGFFQIETPIEGFEVLGAEYNLSVEKINNKVDATVKITQNSEEWLFSAHGQYGADNIIVSFQTPFEEFDTIAVKGSIDYGEMYGKGVIQCGSKRFFVNVSYAMDTLFFELATPFEILKFVHVSAAFNWTARQGDGKLTFVYNENKYMINGVLNVSARTSGITFQVTTPIRNVSMHIKYNIDSKDEIVSAHMTVGDNTYHFIVGGYIEAKRAEFKWDLVSPFNTWTNVKFTASADLTQENKIFEISLEKDENVKAITISGKLIGSTLDFTFKSPITGLQNFNMTGSLNRAKRALQFQMMTDEAEASILTSFNSVSMHLKTPFERAEEITWNIRKIDETSYIAEWKRNDNYITISIDTAIRRPAFNMMVKSELQGWEYLALTGRFDQDTLDAYASGDINEDKISIDISGRHALRSNFTIKITTPYDDYKNIEGNLSYSIRYRRLNLHIKSLSSRFHFNANFTNEDWFTSELLVPHPQEDTKMNAFISPYSGLITITSRYEAIRNFREEYLVGFTHGITFNYTITLNDLNVFTLNHMDDRTNKMFHLETHIHGSDFQRALHIHREGFTKFIFALNFEDIVNDDTIRKQFKIEMTGTENLPVHGTAKVIIRNTFKLKPSITKVNIDVDRRTEQKTIKIDIIPRRRTVYSINIDYNVNLEEPMYGDFIIGITTPNDEYDPWKSISGSWNVENPEANDITLKIGEVTYRVQGKLGLYESTIILTNEEYGESIFFQWRLLNDGDSIDYFLKIGPTARYGMVKLKGTIADIYHAEIEGGFKAGPFQEHEFLFTSKNNQRSDGNLVTTGSFTYGEYRGEHRVVHRGTGKTAMIRLVASSNIPDYENIFVSGTYDVDGKLVFNAEIRIDGRESNINVNFSDLNLLQSHYTAQFHIPIFGEYADFQLTLAYDFLNNTGKFISAVAQIGESKFHVKVNWKESELYNTFEGTIDIKDFFGNILIRANYDVSDMDNAHAELIYSRTDTEESLTVKWTNKKDSNHFEGEIDVQSTIEGVPNARAYSNVDFADGFQLKFGLEWDDKNITASLGMNNNLISVEIITPFQNFESIQGTVEYDLDKKKKSVSLKYERGTRTIDFEATLTKKRQDRGLFTLKLKTQFEGSEEIRVKGNWKKDTVKVQFSTNGQLHKFRSTLDIVVGNSEFDLSFQTPEYENIRIAASYDMKDFLAGSGTNEQKIASIELELLNHIMNFNMHGLRNNEKMYIDINGETSFDLIEKFHLRLGSEISAQVLNITFELFLNEFIFMVRNGFERYENGYYFKTEFDSSFVPLPALVFGLGRKDDERIVTLGYREDRELTFSIKGKENFKSGFSGFVDIPRYGYHEVKYDVDYKFVSDDQLHINTEIELDENKKVEMTLVYDSEGVKARLASPYSGDHSMRVRRSVSSDNFFTEVGFDDYNLKLRGGFKDEDTKRGAILEGDIFGKKFLIDFLFQSEGLQYSEGKLIIQTPFQGMEKMGGLFTWVNEDRKVMARAEVLLPFSETPRIIGEINLNMNKKFDGFITIDVAGKPFTLKSNLAGPSLSQGYQGTVELYTPFHPFSRVYINGNIRMDALSFLEADLDIVEPFNTHEMQLKYELSPEKVIASVTLHTSGLYGGLESTFTLEGLGTAAKKVELTINNDKLTVEYIIRESNFKFKLDSLIMNVQRQLDVEAKYPSLENMEASVLINTPDHISRINLNIVSNRVQGRMELESTLTEGTQKLIFDISVPNASNKHMTFDVALTTSDTHSFYFELDARTGLNTTVKIDTPIFPKITVTTELTAASARLLTETPTGTHMAYVTWRGTFRMPTNWLANVELISPLLTETYNLGVMLNGSNEKRMAKAQLRVGNVIHAIETSASVTTNEGVLILNIETPFKNINEAKFEASLDFRDKVQIQLQAKLAGKINTFNFVFDKEEKTIVSVVESPFIPNGQAVAEAALTGDMKRHMKLQMFLKNGEKTFSGILKVKIDPPEAIKIRLRVAIPHLGYKMSSLAQYTKDDNTSILLYMDSPFYFKVNVNFSNIDDTIKGKLNLETSIEDYQIIQAELDIPLHKFAPRAFLTLPNHEYSFVADFRHDVSSQMSVDFSLDGASYGGNLSLRTRAPYELAYSYHLADAMSSKFHLRTDSSFFSAFV